MKYIIWDISKEQCYWLPFEGDQYLIPQYMSTDQAYRALTIVSFIERMRDKVENFIFKYIFQHPVIFWVLVVGGYLYWALN